MSRRGKKKSSGGGGANWMDTYGDMVTLLLTFFVMLYSMSSLNQQKWEIFVKSIFPNSAEEEQVAINQPLNGEYDVSGEVTQQEKPENMEETADTLYLTLAERLNEMGVEGISVSRGEDYTFLEFKDKVFFAGDSSVLTDQGKEALNIFCEVVEPIKSQIGQVNVMGYTSQADPVVPNEPRVDRLLSADRAAEVTAYIQQSGAIEAEKLISIAFGQHRPVASFDTAENRAKNRRVEILMIDEGADVKSLNEYYEAYTSGENMDTITIEGLTETNAGVEDGVIPE